MGPYRFSYKWGAVVNLEKTPLEPYQGSTTLLREKAIISFEVITKTVPVLARKSLFLEIERRMSRKERKKVQLDLLGLLSY